MKLFDQVRQVARVKHFSNGLRQRLAWRRQFYPSATPSGVTRKA
jgi:hypothetical protein